MCKNFRSGNQLQSFKKSKRGTLLFKSASFLTKNYGFKIKRILKDQIGKYAIEMVSNKNFPLMLVAKSSDISKSGIISFHKSLLQQWRCIIIMAWQPLTAENIIFYAFDPTKCIIFTKFENIRGVEMCNFNISLGTEFNPSIQDIRELWYKIKQKQQTLESFNYFVS